MFERRPGSDHRRHHRPHVRQGGRLRPRRRARRGAQGRHVPARPGGRRRPRARCSTASRPPRCCEGVRGAEPADADALADVIVRLSDLVTDFPRIREFDLNPVFARPDGASAADVRILLDAEEPAAAGPYSQEEILATMNRMMRPNAVAVIGASAENGKIGNSVMKNLINGGFAGRDLPDQPEGRRDPRQEGLQEHRRRARRGRRRGVRGTGEVRGAGAARGAARRTSPPRCSSPPDSPRPATHELQDEIVEIAPRVRRPPAGAEHLRLLLHAAEPLRDVLHALRRQGRGGAHVAVRRHRHGDPRVRPHHQDGRLGDRRPRQQVRPRRGRPAHLLRAGPRYERRRDAPGGPQGRPRRSSRRRSASPRRSRSWCSRPAARRWVRGPRARTPARWPATTRSTTTSCASPAWCGPTR